MPSPNDAHFGFLLFIATVGAGFVCGCIAGQQQACLRLTSAVTVQQWWCHNMHNAHFIQKLFVRIVLAMDCRYAALRFQPCIAAAPQGLCLFEGVCTSDVCTVYTCSVWSSSNVTAAQAPRWEPWAGVIAFYRHWCFVIACCTVWLADYFRLGWFAPHPTIQAMMRSWHGC